MNYDIKELKIIDDYMLKIKFEDNIEGVVIIPKDWLSGVFTPLKNKALFEKVFISNGAVSWEVDGQILDLAPDTMYEEIKGNNGVYTLGARVITTL
jgi:hypothetical protein